MRLQEEIAILNNLIEEVNATIDNLIDELDWTFDNPVENFPEFKRTKATRVDFANQLTALLLINKN